MYLKKPSPFPFPFFSTIILIIITLLSFPLLSLSANVDQQQYEDCAPIVSSCDSDIKIAYPFWDNRQQEYCGHPAFKLQCVDNASLTINIKQHSYNVLSIDYDAKALRILSPQFSESLCPTMLRLMLANNTLDSDLFSLTSNSRNVTLFYDCSLSSSSSSSLEYDPPPAFSCTLSPVSSVKHHLAYLAINSKWNQMLSDACGFEVFTAILEDVAKELENGEWDISHALEQGFEIKWMIDEDGQCEDCVKSGGRCGFNQTLNESNCFCRNGAFDRGCSTNDLPTTAAGRETTRISRVVVAVLVTIGTFTIIGIMYCLWRRLGPRCSKGNIVTGKKTLMLMVDDNADASGIEAGLQDLPLIKFEKLALATNNFDESNKLGQGGFGPVYKGKLENEKEIAVKRLSRASGQGQQEFMNEVVVISKLQHKNLVSLLGCSIKGEEKLLVYEFMRNKSLDALLFDPARRELLGWKMRFGIIKGICRGVLYLHRDSRLKIIHRDLKASNILLDEELNPKISDFGMARIFGSKQDQANTLRVVGTYGYMSPEYAMEGRFSEKSDVFSLGVLLLEIICGQRNCIMNDNESMSLISLAWQLWNEGDILSLIDPTISHPCFQNEVFRSIHVGLLCVQELPQDRPSISTVISMLDYEVIDLPRPLQPGFTQSRYCPSSTNDDVQQQNREQCSLNFVSISSVNGR